MKNFWVQFALSEALSVLGAYINTTQLSDATKQQFMKFIADGEALLQTL